MVGAHCVAKDTLLQAVARDADCCAPKRSRIASSKTATSCLWRESSCFARIKASSQLARVAGREDMVLQAAAVIHLGFLVMQPFGLLPTGVWPAPCCSGCSNGSCQPVIELFVEHYVLLVMS